MDEDRKERKNRDDDEERGMKERDGKIRDKLEESCEDERLERKEKDDGERQPRRTETKRHIEMKERTEM